MKTFLLLALVAAAVAEPQYFPYNLGYPAGVPVPIHYKPVEVKTLPEEKQAVVQEYAKQPMVKAVEQPLVYYQQQPAFTYGVNPFYAALQGVKTYANDAAKPEQYAAKNQYKAENAGAIHFAKREAEAEPVYPYFYNAAQVTPYQYSPVQQVAYNAPYYKPYATYTPYAAYTGPQPYLAGQPNYVNDAITAKGYAGKGTYVAKSAGAIHIAKREAEAEAEPEPVYPFFYNAAQVTPYQYSPVQQVAYNAPYYKPYATYTPYAAYTGPQPYLAGQPNYVNDAITAKGYAGKGTYVAKSAGAIHIAKREADAEPILPYFGYPASAYANTYYNRPAVSAYSTYFNRPYSFGSALYPSAYYY